MDVNMILLVLAAVACPIVMGIMMWWMMSKNQMGEHNHTSAAERLEALRQQQRLLEQEITELEKVMTLETQKEIMAGAGESSPDGRLQPVEKMGN